MCVTIEEDDEKWWTKLNACKWLRYVSKALHGAASLAKLLNYNNIQFVGRENVFIDFSVVESIFFLQEVRSIIVV
jgi:hypothetical protein